jgi:hypothetical protein
MVDLRALIAFASSRSSKMLAPWAHALSKGTSAIKKISVIMLLFLADRDNT